MFLSRFHGCGGAICLLLGALLVHELPESPLAVARATFVRGDVDDSGKLDVTDSIRILSELFVEGRGLTCADAADLNDSGSLEITDAIYGLQFLFSGGPAPLPPFPRCAPDPTADALGCVSPEFCDPADSARASVTLAWDPPTTNEDGSRLDDLAGYVLAWRGAAQERVSSVRIGNTSRYTVTDLEPGDYIFAVAAYDISGNVSAPSEELRVEVR